MKKYLLAVGLTAALVGGGSFYGGMAYAKGRPAKGVVSGTRQFNAQFGSGSGANGQMRLGGAGGQRDGGGLVSGEILASDSQSLTVKMRDGSTKIVLFGTSAEISKFVVGTAADLKVGETVLVTGTANDDGSVTAKTVQIRPAGAAEFIIGGGNRQRPTGATAP